MTTETNTTSAASPSRAAYAGIDPRNCAERAAEILEQARSRAMNWTGDDDAARATALVKVANGYRELGATIAVYPAMNESRDDTNDR